MLRVYRCTVYERPSFGDPQPVVVDGHEWADELVAETAGKARYRYWRRVHECYEDVRLQDIRVRSLSKRRADPMSEGWQGRLELANAIIRVIASHGRHFLSENSDRREPVADPFIAHFTVDRQGELWFVDRYSRKPILVRHREWPGFTDGGTLRAIVQHLAQHITEDAAINSGYFGVSPSWMNDHWGYGADMQKVADGVGLLLTLPPSVHPEAAAC